MTAPVVPIHEPKATPQQVLAQAYSMAERGLLRDVVLVTTTTDGEMKIAWAGCTAQDLAAAALYIQHKAVKAFDFDDQGPRA